MANDILSYEEMCALEGRRLQRGMNYMAGQGYSIILSSTRPNSPYNDKYEEGNSVLIYEGHDVPRHNGINPKAMDQPEFFQSGRRTENGKFHLAAQEFKKGNRPAERVKVYEKIREGIWVFNGIFRLVDSYIENTGKRNVFKFRLEIINDSVTSEVAYTTQEQRRIIPSNVKREVWIRDGGKCVICGSTKNLHFDHIIPYSKGGSSITAENIQILCLDHNLKKRDKIE